jgi:hypothetical protein
VFGSGKIRKIDENHCLATWDTVLIQVWRLETTSEAVADLVRITRAFIAEQTHSICSIALIEGTSPAPTDVVRKQLSNFYREFAPSMEKAIVVAEGGGFRAALVRGVGITLSMLAPSALPFTFVGSTREATLLIGKHLSPGAGGTEALQRVVAQVRAEASARA